MSVWSAGFSLFFVCNALGNMPFFLSLLKNFPEKRQAYILLREMLFALSILLVFSFFGDEVLSFLGINHRVIEIGGGFLLLLLALKMIFPSEASHKALQDEPILVPIAIPGVAGPGAIAMTMFFGSQMTSSWSVLAAIFIAWIPTVLILTFSTRIKRILSKQMFVAMERFGGLLMCLIAVQLILMGIIHLIKDNFSL